MNTTGNKIIAILEVLLVKGITFAVAWFGLAPLVGWQRQTLGHTYLNHLAFMLIPIAWLLLTGRRLTDFGITACNLKADVTAAMSAFLPFALAGASLGFLAYTRWHDALIESAIQVGVLFWVAHLLNRKPDPKSGLITIGLASVLFGVSAWREGLYPGLAAGAGSFVYYLFFVGLGEELLNRGFIQTRLDQAFGKPFAFGGARFGWGIVIASLLFGLLHVANGLDPIAGTFNPQWWWGLWTFFGGLVFGYVRERTGSIIAPAVLHGLPQALVFFFLKGS